MKRAIAQLAAAQGRAFDSRRAFRTHLATREGAPRRKGPGGTRQMDDLATGWQLWQKAPDLGLRNRRFQNVPFRFKKQSFYEGKRDFVVSIASSRPASKNVLILAQFLAQNRLSSLRVLRD